MVAPAFAFLCSELCKIKIKLNVYLKGKSLRFCGTSLDVENFLKVNVS